MMLYLVHSAPVPQAGDVGVQWAPKTGRSAFAISAVLRHSVVDEEGGAGQVVGAYDFCAR